MVKTSKHLIVVLI